MLRKLVFADVILAFIVIMFLNEFASSFDDSGVHFDACLFWFWALYIVLVLPFIVDKVKNENAKFSDSYRKYYNILWHIRKWRDDFDSFLINILKKSFKEYGINNNIDLMNFMSLLNSRVLRLEKGFVKSINVFKFLLLLFITTSFSIHANNVYASEWAKISIIRDFFSYSNNRALAIGLFVFLIFMGFQFQLFINSIMLEYHRRNLKRRFFYDFEILRLLEESKIPIFPSYNVPAVREIFENEMECCNEIDREWVMNKMV